MISRIFFTCVLAAVHLTADAAIEFSATQEERALEGVKYKLLFFKDNGKTVSYQPPRGWSVAGGGGGLKMTPPALVQAQGEIAQSPLAAPQPLDGEVMKALQQKALASLPPGSEKVAVVSEGKTPITVSGHETYAVTVSYQAFGQEFLMDMVYLNLPETRVCFRATARKEDFEKVQGAVRGSILSWQWVRPKASDASPMTASK
jgi:hypothetical protein